MAAKKSAETLFVYANLPNGQSFRLSAGRTVTLEGYPVSKLVDDMGNALPAGQYGITELPAEDWRQVEKLYGQLTVMQSGVIFAAVSREQGDAMAAERCGLRHGVEPIDPATTTTKPLEADKE